eukprot:1501379-Rhodomonas_salina.1
MSPRGPHRSVARVPGYPGTRTRGISTTGPCGTGSSTTTTTSTTRYNSCFLATRPLRPLAAVMQYWNPEQKRSCICFVVRWNYPGYNPGTIVPGILRSSNWPYILEVAVDAPPILSLTER